MNNRLYCRENKDLECKLFKIIDDIYDKKIKEFKLSDTDQMLSRLIEFEELNNFLNSITNEELESNIYLKNAKIYMNTSFYDGVKIVKRINIKRLNVRSKSMDLKFKIPDDTHEYIPNHISEEIAIDYYNPRKYKFEYVNVLDSSHRYIYEDYNHFVAKNEKLCEVIYLLQLNNIISNISDNLICYFFQVYHPRLDDHFNISVSLMDNASKVRKRFK